MLAIKSPTLATLLALTALGLLALLLSVAVGSVSISLQDLWAVASGGGSDLHRAVSYTHLTLPTTPYV